MMKKFVLALSLFGLLSGSVLFAEMVTGVIDEIAEDSSYIVVDGSKVNTTPEFVEDAMFDAGDNVEIKVEDGQAVDFRYLG